MGGISPGFMPSFSCSSTIKRLPHRFFSSFEEEYFPKKVSNVECNLRFLLKI